MGIKAILFDMDGTIIESEYMHTKTIQKVVEEEFGVNLSAEEIEKHIGFNYAQKLERIFGDKYDKNEYQRVRLVIRRRTLKNFSMVKKIKGAEEVIKEMKRNFKIALVTGSSREQEELFLEEVDLKKYFDVRITGSDVEKNKPYPDSYLLAAEKLGVKPEDCVVLEDSETGINAGKSAGMKCIGIRHRYNQIQDFSKADKVVNNIAEIDIELLKSLDEID